MGEGAVLLDRGAHSKLSEYRAESVVRGRDDFLGPTA
jgi:hypothetical protein